MASCQQTSPQLACHYKQVRNWLAINNERKQQGRVLRSLLRRAASRQVRSWFAKTAVAVPLSLAMWLAQGLLWQ